MAYREGDESVMEDLYRFYLGTKETIDELREEFEERAMIQGVLNDKGMLGLECLPTALRPFTDSYKKRFDTKFAALDPEERKQYFIMLEAVFNFNLEELMEMMDEDMNVVEMLGEFSCKKELLGVRLAKLIVSEEDFSEEELFEAIDYMIAEFRVLPRLQFLKQEARLEEYERLTKVLEALIEHIVVVKNGKGDYLDMYENCLEYRILDMVMRFLRLWRPIADRRGE